MTLQRITLLVSVLSFILSACSTTPTTEPDSYTPLALSSGTSLGSAVTANPVICGCTNYQVGNDATWQAISVMNADGSKYTRLVAGHHFLSYSTWSGNGSSISYIDSYGSGSIMKFNVSVVNNTPTATNLSTLCSLTSVDSSLYTAQAWSPTANEIAYVKAETNASKTSLTRVARVYVLPTNGGSASLIYAATGAVMKGLCWSPDGTKLAVMYGDIATSTSSLKIIDRSSGSVLQSYSLAGISPLINKGLDWSRGSQNTVIFPAKASSSSTTWTVYSVDVSQSTSTPVASSIPATEKPWSPCYSPDNSQIVYGSTSASTNPTRVFTLATNTISAFATPSLSYDNYLQWKR